MKGTIATVLAVGSLLATSCGGDSAPRKTDISECRPSWTVLLETSENLGRIQHGTDVFSGLIWNNDRLYFTYLDRMGPEPHTVLASLLTASDGTQRAGTVAQLPLVDFMTSWWIEGDQLTSLKRDGIYGQPLDGSASALQQLPLSLFEDRHYYDFALDADALYWSDATDPYVSPTGTVTWSVWRASRSTGERTKLADLPTTAGMETFKKLILTPDRILLIDGFGSPGLTNTLYALPKTGGAPQILVTSQTAEILGVAKDGSALWRNFSSGGTEAYKLWRSEGNGEAQVPVWPDISSGEFATNAWSDGNGEWYVATTTYFNSNVSDPPGASVWRIDSSGQATRLTCNPPPADTYTLSGVLSPSALYLLQWDLSQTQSIVSIGR